MFSSKRLACSGTASAWSSRSAPIVSDTTLFRVQLLHATQMLHGAERAFVENDWRDFISDDSPGLEGNRIFSVNVGVAVPRGQQDGLRSVVIKRYDH